MGQSSLFQDLENLSDTQVDLENYNFIPTVKYREKISELCRDLNELENIRTYCPIIAINDGTMFYTSSLADYSAIYIDSGLCRADNYFHRAYHHEGHYLITAGLYGDSLQRSVINILESYFQVYNTYCLIRRCEDCVVIIALSHKIAMLRPEEIYQKTVLFIEEFTIKYFNALIDLYVEYLPGLKYSRFAKDNSYRSLVIKKREGKVNRAALLTQREIECLYWISRGKTSQDIALLMKISEYTVNEHKKNIIRKLNVSNIAYAVHDAIKLGVIN